MAGINEKLPLFYSSDEVLARGLNGMARTCERMSLFNPASGMGFQSDGNGVTYLPDQFDPAILFYNSDSVNSIPAYGVALLSGINSDGGSPIYKVAQPDRYGVQGNWLLNGGSVIPKSSPGWAQAVFGMGPTGSVGFKALYDSSTGTPTNGDRWGTRSGSYLLQANTGGFLVTGIFSSTDHIALVIPEPFTMFRGVANADIASLATGAVSIYYRNSATTYISTGVNATAFNSLNATVKSGKNVWCEYQPYSGTSDAWSIIQADC